MYDMAPITCSRAKSADEIGGFSAEPINQETTEYASTDSSLNARADSSTNNNNNNNNKEPGSLRPMSGLPAVAEIAAAERVESGILCSNHLKIIHSLLY